MHTFHIHIFIETVTELYLVKYKICTDVCITKLQVGMAQIHSPSHDLVQVLFLYKSSHHLVHLVCFFFFALIFSDLPVMPLSLLLTHHLFLPLYYNCFLSYSPPM